MSLRTEMREALDHVVPIAPTPGISERVLRMAVSEGARRRKKERWTYRMRAPLSLVAAFIGIAVVAGMLLGGSLIRDWNGLHKTNPGGQRTLAQLEAVPLNLPVVRADALCPENRSVNSFGYDYGSGPVYVNGRLLAELTVVSQDGTGEGLYDLTYYSQPDLKGLFLVRGRDLVKGSPIMFIAPQGPGFPADTPPWPSKDELVLDASNPPSRDATTGYGIWRVRLVIGVGWSGCWGLQIDGSDFTERITGFERQPGTASQS